MDLHGRGAGLVALLLWCLSPNVLAWASTIQPDAAAAALGIAACYAFWRWNESPTWSSAAISGVLLGLAELSKTTWIILFVLWPFLWLVCRKRQIVAPPARQLALILFLGIYVLNLGYGFDGTLQPLGSYTFVSRSLSGQDSRADGGEGGNRFQKHWLRSVPIPFPKPYVAGIDLQKSEFEVGGKSYLFGKWKHGGWWYYYVVAAIFKVPLAAWVLGGMALFASCWNIARAHQHDRMHLGRPDSSCATAWLLAPPLLLLLLVSSQTGFSRYFRYVLPCFPFVFVWISGIARPRYPQHRTWSIGLTIALSAFAVSSLWIFPHSMSYFNELAGGPTRGHKYLLDANIDWEQDMFFLRDWINAHPDAKPLSIAACGCLPCECFGLPAELPPEGPSSNHPTVARYSPHPGVFAVSVRRLRASHNGDYEYFLDYEPIAVVGYSIYVYDITLEDANRLRRRMGLRELRALSKGGTPWQ